MNFFTSIYIGLAALGVAQIGFKLLNPAVPVFDTMRIFCLLSLALSVVERSL